MKKHNIVLIGFMGSGKTSNGIALSYKKKIPFVDTDHLIEQAEKRPITEIFATDGEECFRKAETACLTRLLENTDKTIISVGGGTPVRAENRPLLKQLGCVVYLRVKPETVIKRLKGDTTRPLLQGDNPEETVRRLMEAREEAYADSADVILDMDDYRNRDGVEAIVKAVKDFENREEKP
ncbi:MAG: shikimate kinase [Lachnospiraceae bacterium]|nr:shikimate kinase [Lachnospiraceae bacterium]